ncbi:M15 family metallopeptidase [Thermopolyspora sp. NPDC052614]|uniref:M15 family metallopeptidase n=1 Tax=Thermopolyspora sp. NPDC052614 TaxID=3155682 RepID=UPI003425F96C
MARIRMLPYLGFLALAGICACGGGTSAGAHDAVAAPATPSQTRTATDQAEPSAPAETVTPRPTPTGPPPFSAKIQKVDRADLSKSWRPGCPVSPAQLRMIVMTYWGFDGKQHTGRLVVHESVAEEVASIFKKLYDQRYPIRRMEPVDKYDGDDYRSIDADNTSAFNCRPATGSTSWSKHSYGKAIDLNPRENPYIYADGTNSHRNADAFVKRPLKKPGVINPGDRVIKTFAAEGWEWGGYWSGAKDYQHFSKGGG